MYVLCVLHGYACTHRYTRTHECVYFFLHIISVLRDFITAVKLRHLIPENPLQHSLQAKGPPATSKSRVLPPS